MTTHPLELLFQFVGFGTTLKLPSLFKLPFFVVSIENPIFVKNQPYGMEVLSNISALPRTLAEFQLWEPNDGYKYEWNDGELIKFTGMNKKQIKIYDILLELFFQKGYKKLGTFVAEYDVQLTGIQMRRPDIAFLSRAQLDEASKGGDPVPEFMIEVISESDNINKVLAKISEYYKFGAKVVWLIFPEEKQVHVYTSRRDVKICIENDICSAAPVLPEFEISIETLFAE